MKPTSKKDYPFVVECETQKQTKDVLNHYDNNNDEWTYWKYVVIINDLENDIFGTEDYIIKTYGELPMISYSEWLQLTDYALEEVAFKESKKIIGYKLTKPEYEEAAGRIAYGKLSSDNYKFIKHKDDIAFLFKSNAHERLQEAGVLDLWFKPVYEEPTKEEKILNFLAGHGLNVNPEYVKDIINIVNENNESK